MKAPTPQHELIEAAGDEAEPELLRTPSLAEQKTIVAHLFKEHRYSDFRLPRDVYLGGGTRQDSQLITWDPVGSRFWCASCKGLVFTTGEVTTEMLRHAQRFDAALAPHLAGLATQAERDEMTRLYLSGHLNQERLRAFRRAGPRRRAASRKRPQVADRRRSTQKWILERLAVHGVQERVYDEAEAMQRDDPDAWKRIAFRPLSRETLRKYAHDIDPALKAKARERGAASEKRREKLTRFNT